MGDTRFNTRLVHRSGHQVPERICQIYGLSARLPAFSVAVHITRRDTLLRKSDEAAIRANGRRPESSNAYMVVRFFSLGKIRSVRSDWPDRGRDDEVTLRAPIATYSLSVRRAHSIPHVLHVMSLPLGPSRELESVWSEGEGDPLSSELAGSRAPEIH